MVRLQTLFIVQASGAKAKGGGELKETDLWLLPNEKKQMTDKKVWGSKEDAEELKRKIEKAHGIKL